MFIEMDMVTVLIQVKNPLHYSNVAQMRNSAVILPYTTIGQLVCIFLLPAKWLPEQSNASSFVSPSNLSN